MPRYITPGDKVQFFKHEEEQLPEVVDEEVLEEYTDNDHDHHDNLHNDVHGEHLEVVKFNSNESIKEYNTSDPPNVLNNDNVTNKKKSSNNELFFFLILLLIAFGAAIFLKTD
jgi:hypothetical protein